MNNAHLKLPYNRVQSFIDCLLHKKTLIFLSGLMILLFALPLLLVLGITNIISYEITLQLKEGLITNEVANGRLFETYNAANLLFIPALMVLFVGLAGTFRVTRRMIFQDDVSFFYDFRTGLKSNTKYFLFTALIIGVLRFVMMFLFRAGLVLPSSSWLDITFAVSVAGLVLTLLLTPFILLQTDLYNLSFFATIRNAFLLGMKSALTTLPLLIISFAPWLLMLITYNGPTYFIVLALLLILFTPLSLLAVHEYGLSILDRYVNKTHYPEIYEKGIYRRAEH